MDKSAFHWSVARCKFDCVHSAFVNIDIQAHGNIFDSFALKDSYFDLITLVLNQKLIASLFDYPTNNIQKRYHQIGAFIWQIMQMHATTILHFMYKCIVETVSVVI